MSGKFVRQVWDLHVSQFRRVVLWYKLEEDVELLTIKIYNTGVCEAKMSLTIAEMLQIPINDIIDSSITSETRLISNGRRKLEIRVLPNNDAVCLSLFRYSVGNVWKKLEMTLYNEELVVLGKYMQEIISRDVDKELPAVDSLVIDSGEPDLLDETVIDPMDICN